MVDIIYRMDSRYFCRECDRQADSLSDGVCPRCARRNDETVPPKQNDDLDSPTLAPLGQTETLSSSTNPASQFGDYELIEEIARGGMGVVFKARHRKLNRISALKMILAGRFSSTDELQRFQIEARSAASLDHPGIVPIYDIGESEGRAFFAMKYIDGGALSDSIDLYYDQPDKAAELIAKISDAIHHAHQRGILHRDLKPANILLDDQQPVVTDLGLAKSTSGGSELTHTGAVLGTPSYMPPEQARGETATTASDIYSIGAIMYELLTGQPPHKGDSSVNVLMKVMDSEITSPMKINPSADRDLDLICMKCLDPDPKNRYSTAEAIAVDLKAWGQGESISVRPPSLMYIAQRWIRQNQRSIYSLFALSVTILVCTILLIGFQSSNGGAVYDHFPNEPRPLLFRLTSLPGWLSAVVPIGFAIALWPALGFVNSFLTRPRNFLQALGYGVATSVAFSLLIYVLIGWLIISTGIRNVSSDKIDTLTQAVWPPADLDKADAEKRANSMYSGLEQIPDQEKAKIVRQRIIADNFAIGPTSLSYFLLFCLTFSIPIVLGTMIAHQILRQEGRVWVAAIRYFIAFYCLLLIVVSLVMMFGITFDNQTVQASHQDPKNLLIIFTLSLVFAWLCLKSWRRNGNPTVDKVQVAGTRS